MKTLLLILVLPLVTLGQGYRNRPAPPVTPEARQQMEEKLKEAQATLDSNPNSADAMIWVGRRLAYLGRFTDAIDVYTKGIAKFPGDARFYRHRGHRYITLREFDSAINDFEKAAALVKGKPDEIEPDGQPNAKNIPTSTLQFNIWYHLGLAYYLKGQGEKAVKAYRECLKVSKTPDRLVSVSNWLYLTFRRLGRKEDAEKVLIPISRNMDIIENQSYHRLLLMYKGDLPLLDLGNETFELPDSPSTHSTLYGIAIYTLGGHGAFMVPFGSLKRILASEQWTSFGFIAAESFCGRAPKEADEFFCAKPQFWK